MNIVGIDSSVWLLASSNSRTGVISVLQNWKATDRHLSKESRIVDVNNTNSKIVHITD